MADDQLEYVDESQDAGEQYESAKSDEEDEFTKAAREKEAEKKRMFDGDRFDFSGQCDVCSAGLLDGKDHMEFLIERNCAPTRNFFYRNAISKHWPDFQGLSTNMQPYCPVCQKHFWGMPDITRHVYCMAVYGVEDVRHLEDYTDVEVKKEETTKREETKKKKETKKTREATKKVKTTPATVEEKKPDEKAKDANTKNQKNKSRMKRRRQAYADALEAEFQRRVKRAGEIAASLPEEEIPDEAQREANKESHASLYETIIRLIDMGSGKEPTEDAIELLNQIICGQSPRWFEASYLLGGYENTSQQQDSSSAQQDLTSGRSNVALLEARWRLSKNEIDGSSYLELTGKLNEQSQLSAADRERALRRIAENGDLWKDDECSPSGETFTCLVCDRKGRSLRVHLVEALWLTKVNSVSNKKSDLPDCPILTEAFLSEMRSNTVMAHVYHYLGEEHTRRLIEELSFKTDRVLRCPACSFHYRALRCCLPDLFSHIQEFGFMKIDGEFKDAHQNAALQISSILAEARSGFRSTWSIVSDLVAYLGCSEGGLHLQRRGAVTVESLKSNPRMMVKIRQAVARKQKEEVAKAAVPAKKAKAALKKAPTVPVKSGKSASRDTLRGVQQTKQMKSKKTTVVGRGKGFRSNGVGASGGSMTAVRGGRGGGGRGGSAGRGRISHVMGTHVPVNIRSAPVGRMGNISGGMFGGRSQIGMNQLQVGVYCELCSKEYFGYTFNEANRLLHAHLMDAIFRSRREPGKTNMAAQHLKCFSSNLVYNRVSFCPACQLTRNSLDAVLHHITQLASSNDLSAVQHMNIANDLISQFVDCMNGTIALDDLSIFVKRRFIR